jgi:hypothetical protein
MAEDDFPRKRYITGRQFAHMTFTLRKAPPTRESEWKELDALPDVSVVSWAIREEICQPYRIEAVVFASQAFACKAVLGQFARFTIQPEDERELREFFGLVARFEFLSESRDGCTYRVVVRQRLAMLDVRATALPASARIMAATGAAIAAGMTWPEMHDDNACGHEGRIASPAPSRVAHPWPICLLSVRRPDSSSCLAHEIPSAGLSSSIN